MILPSVPLPSLWTGLAAALAYAMVALWGGRLPEKRTQALVTLAWALHAFSVLLSLLSTEGPPRFGFAPALSATAWLVLTFYTLERHWFPQLKARWVLAGLGAWAVLLALLFPGQPLHLKASAWLPLHWVLGLASYGLFAAAVVHAALMTRTEKLIRQAVDVEGTLPLLTLERLTFRFVKAGFALLSATLLAGWWFSDHLYGPEVGWRWDHKTVFAVLAWLTFAGLLIARQRLGWRGRKATRVLYAGAGLLLLSYAGSRFVMEVILGRAT